MCAQSRRFRVKSRFFSRETSWINSRGETSECSSRDENQNNEVGKYLIFHVTDYFAFHLTRFVSSRSAGGKRNQPRWCLKILFHCRRQQNAAAKEGMSQLNWAASVCFRFRSFSTVIARPRLPLRRSLIANKHLASAIVELLDHQIYFIFFNHNRMNHPQWLIFQIEVFPPPRQNVSWVTPFTFRRSKGRCGDTQRTAITVNGPLLNLRCYALWCTIIRWMWKFFQMETHRRN